MVVYEMKYSHTARAWWQLRRMYEPLLRAYTLQTNDANWTIEVCEVTKWYDPQVDFPEPVTLVRDPSSIPKGKFGVHIWSPDGEYPNGTDTE